MPNVTRGRCPYPGMHPYREHCNKVEVRSILGSVDIWRKDFIFQLVIKIFQFPEKLCMLAC